MISSASTTRLLAYENGDTFVEFAVPSCANLLARKADRSVGRNTWTANFPALVIVLAAEEGVLILKEIRGCGFNEKQLNEERVIPRHDGGEDDVAEVTITTYWLIWNVS